MSLPDSEFKLFGKDKELDARMLMDAKHEYERVYAADLYERATRKE